MLLTRLPDTNLINDEKIKELFSHDMEAFGIPYRWEGSYIMSGGPYGASMFYRCRFDPQSAEELMKLMNYADDIHHNMVVIIMRNNHTKVGSPTQRLPTFLNISEFEALDELTPTSTIGWGNKLSPYECELIDNAISEWIVARDKMEELIIQNKVLYGLVAHLRNEINRYET
jgi:hypothetical protein